MLPLLAYEKAHAPNCAQMMTTGIADDDRGLIAVPDASFGRSNDHGERHGRCNCTGDTDFGVIGDTTAHRACEKNITMDDRFAVCIARSIQSVVGLDGAAPDVVVNVTGHD